MDAVFLMHVDITNEMTYVARITIVLMIQVCSVSSSYLTTPEINGFHHVNAVNAVYIRDVTININQNSKPSC